MTKISKLKNIHTVSMCIPEDAWPSLIEKLDSQSVAYSDSRDSIFSKLSSKKLFNAEISFWKTYCSEYEDDNVELSKRSNYRGTDCIFHIVYGKEVIGVGSIALQCMYFHSPIGLSE